MRPILVALLFMAGCANGSPDHCGEPYPVEEQVYAAYDQQFRDGDGVSLESVEGIPSTFEFMRAEAEDLEFVLLEGGKEIEFRYSISGAEKSVTMPIQLWQKF